MRTLISSGYVLAALLLLAGCGSDSAASASPSCAAFSACGGDLVGTWQVQRSCFPNLSDLSKPPEGCPAAVIEVEPAITGSITFAADGTARNALRATVSETATFPTSCFNDAACTRFATDVRKQPGNQTATCAYSVSDGCSCKLTFSQAFASDGTYSISGTQVTLSSPGEADEVDDFCVTGASLDLRTTSEDGVATLFATR